MEIWLGSEATVRLSHLDQVCDEDRRPRLPNPTSRLLLKPLPLPLPLPAMANESARTHTERLLLLPNQNLDDSPNIITSLSLSHLPHHSLASLSKNL